MSYIKHDIQITELSDLDSYLTSIAEEIPWLYHNYTNEYPFTMDLGLNNGTENPIKVISIQKPSDDIKVDIPYNSNNSNISWHNTSVFMRTDLSNQWFNSIYVTNNYVAFTSDGTNNDEYPYRKKILFIISKLGTNNVCVIPDIGLDSNGSAGDSLSKTGAFAICPQTVEIRAIPTKDCVYNESNRLGRKTILAPIPCNDLNNSIPNDIYAVVAKEHPSICDVLLIGDHHFLTNGRIACQLD